MAKAKEKAAGICSRQQKFYGIITVTDKGQIAIPIDLRKDLNIKAGDKLIVVKREDSSGINLIKGEEMEKFLNKIANN